MKLRYTGIDTTTFANPLVGEVHPGQEFFVSDEEAAAYLTRADVEVAEETTSPGPFTAPAPLPPADPEPVRDEEEEPEAPEVN